MCPSRVIFLTGCFTFVLMLPARLLCFPTLEDRLALVGNFPCFHIGSKLIRSCPVMLSHYSLPCKCPHNLCYIPVMLSHGPYFLFFCRGFRLVGPMVIMIYRSLTSWSLRYSDHHGYSHGHGHGNPGLVAVFPTEGLVPLTE